MRCIICDELLTSSEEVRKLEAGHPLAGEFLDTCNVCMIEVWDMMYNQDYETDEEKESRCIK